jgi:hypothetical protein
MLARDRERMVVLVIVVGIIAKRVTVLQEKPRLSAVRATKPASMDAGIFIYVSVRVVAVEARSEPPSPLQTSRQASKQSSKQASKLGALSRWAGGGIGIGGGGFGGGAPTCTTSSRQVLQ